MRNSLPSVSVVIEWENARLSELGRTREMLAALSTQLREVEDRMAEPPELIVLHDAEAVDPALVRGCVEEAFGTPPRIALRTETTDGDGYYAQKNAGAALATRDLLLFLDSDVVPEPGWLSTLLGNFADPKVDVVCGNTYVDAEDFASRAFALFWFFPLRSAATPDAAPVESEHFFANNVVFRRELFNAYRFPELPMMRGQCVQLARRLREDGHTILIDRRARVSHPPPNGLSHFVRRALVEGHDAVQQDRLRGGGRYGFGLGTPWRFVRSVGGAAKRIGTHRKDVGLGPVGAAGAMGLALGYYALCAAGEVLGRVSPGLVKRHLSV